MTQEIQKTPNEAKERVAVSSTRLLECVELAIIANGGGAHKKEMCRCDASVGMCPCEYCAIWDALNKTFNYLLDLKGKHSNSEIRHGGTDPLELKPQRNPPLPASNG